MGGRLYAVGGYDATLQDLRCLESLSPFIDNAWQQLRPMEGPPRCALGAVACAGELYVLGGAVGDVDRTILGTVERYEPKAGIWFSVGSLRAPRRRFGAC